MFSGFGANILDICEHPEAIFITDWKQKQRSDVQLSSEIQSESCQIELYFDCNYTFPINLASNGIQFGVKSNGKV